MFPHRGETFCRSSNADPVVLGFLAAEFPTQYLAQHLSRLGLYLGTNIVIWGLILGFHGACKSFAELSVVRTLLGVFESW